MDGDADDLELLLESARYEVRVVREDFRLRDLAGSRGSALRQHVLDLLGAVEHRLAGRPPPGAPESASRAFARSVRQGVVMLRAAHAALPWLEATRTPNLDLGSLYMTEEYARILVGTDVDLVVVPDPEFMYSTTSWPFLEVIASTAGFTPAALSRPIVLNYPLSDSNRLLAHAIFAHELGHPAVHEHSLVAAVEAELDADPAFTSALQTVTQQMGPQWPALTPPQVTSTLRGLLRGWIEELLCDHLAIKVAGPAFIWSFAAFVVPLSYGTPGPSHPPNTLRIRLALEFLEREGWRPWMEQVCPQVTRWLDGMATSATDSLPAPYDFLRDELQRHAAEFQGTAISRCGSGSLLAADAQVHATEAARLLENHILPVGLESPLEVRSILLGGWQEGVRLHGDSPAGLVGALADASLQDLLGKAIEMSAVKTTWEGAP